jgi:AraC family transcriptional regulator, mar-sox-rob regulon activator
MLTKNRFFDSVSLSVLLDTTRWKLVSSFAPPDAPVVRNRRHHRWAEKRHHQHAYPEIMFVLRGKSWYSLRETIYEARPGTVFYFDAAEEHDSGYPAFAPQCEHLWFGVLKDRFTAWFIRHDKRGLSHDVLPCTGTQKDAGIDFVQTIFRLRNKSGLPPALLRARCLSAVSALVCAVIEKGYSEPEEPEGKFQEEIVSRIQEHLKETAGRGASLKSLARLAGYSKFHFLRLFKKHSGRTLQEYVNTCRLERVEELRKSGRSQKDISEALGFSCPQSFSRWQKERWQK